VIVTLDTLRADHVSSYGYDKTTSPYLDAFAARATRYANAYATAPWTGPSHASLFTGLHPFEHGAVSFDTKRPGRNLHPLAAQHHTLAEVLRSEGFETAGFIANSVYLDRGFGLEQGFETWSVERAWSPELNQRVFDWLDRNAARPFFLFVNYMDTHRPYNVTPRAGQAPIEEQEASPRLLDALYRDVMAEGREPGELAERLVEQYDRAVTNLDEGVGRLLERLQALGLDENTLIVITSDHGEYFGEHDLVEHSKDVYEPGLRIPLLVKEPGQRTGRLVRQPASLVDVPRIVLAALPARVREGHLRAFPHTLGSHPIVAENYFSRPHDLRNFPARFRRVRTAILEGDWKYIHSSDGQHELYDTALDPGESRDQAERHPAVVRRFAPLLAEIQATRSERARTHRAGAEPGAIPPELRARMAALGYVEPAPGSAGNQTP
jgi:arylsulfatase A-like enzyme